MEHLQYARHCPRSWKSRGYFKKQNPCLHRGFTIKNSTALLKVHTAVRIFTQKEYTAGSDLTSLLTSGLLSCVTMPVNSPSAAAAASFDVSQGQRQSHVRHDYSNPGQASQAFRYSLIILIDILEAHRGNAMGLVICILGTRVCVLE